MKAEGPFEHDMDDQVLLVTGFALAEPAVTTIITGTHNVDHLKSNIELVSNCLPIPDGHGAGASPALRAGGRRLAAANVAGESTHVDRAIGGSVRTCLSEEFLKFCCILLHSVAFCCIFLVIVKLDGFAE